MARKTYGNPAHRLGKTDVQRAQDDFKHAHREVVAAIEWLARGEPGQFAEQALDRAALAYRFLQQALINNGRTPPEPVDD